MSQFEHIGTTLASMRKPGTEPAPDPWICPVCGPVPPLQLPRGRWIARSCSCQIAAKNATKARQEQEHWMEQQAIRTFGGWLGASYVDDYALQTMKAQTFDNFSVEIFPVAYECAMAFSESLKGNLLL